MHVCMFEARKRVCMYVCMYVCMFEALKRVCMYVCMYVSTQKITPGMLQERFFKIFSNRPKSYSRKVLRSYFLRFSAADRKVTPGKLQKDMLEDFQPQTEKLFQETSRTLFFKIFSHKPKSQSRTLPAGYFLKAFNPKRLNTSP